MESFFKAHVKVFKQCCIISHVSGFQSNVREIFEIHIKKLIVNFMTA